METTRAARSASAESAKRDGNDVALAPVTPEFSVSTRVQTSLIAALAHPQDFVEFRACDRLNGKPRQAEECHSFQLRVPLDLVERDWFRQRLLRRQIHGTPIPFFCRRVPI